jgi:REP element-mobilizing transposase RayT
MARKPRLHVSGGLYHVILRGNARQDVFFSPGDRHFFYELLAEGVIRFGYRVHAFCLMPNHLHLALQVGDLELSAGMQNLSFRYTRYLNTRLKRVGHVFQRRFKAFLVDQDRYGLALVRYLHLNPVRARTVRQPGAYAWSSHRAYLGEEDFLKKVLPRREAKRKAPSLRQIVAYVCDGYGLTQGALKAPGKGRQTAQARALVAWLAVRFRSCTLTEVAGHFSRSPSTLSHLVANLEKLSHSSGEPADALRKHLYAHCRPGPIYPPGIKEPLMKFPSSGKNICSD